MSAQPSRSAVVVCTGAVLAGLSIWFLYVAVQPRDYSRPPGAADRLETFFGWRAPAIDPGDLVERNRIWCAVAGWVVVGLVAGRLRPELWPAIGPLVVLPVLAVYAATAPRDAEGWWRIEVLLLPAAAALASAAARVAPSLNRLFGSIPLLAGAVGALFALALFVGGGETPATVAGVGSASALLVVAVMVVRWKE